MSSTPSQRPFILDPLFRSVGVLNGVGPKYLKLYEKLLGGTKLLDLIFHKPGNIVERHFVENIAAAQMDDTVALTVTIDKHTPSPHRSQPYRIRARDPSGFIDLVFFNAHGNWIEAQYPLNKQVTLCGKIEDFRGGKQIIHPELLDSENPEKTEIIYPLTAGLTTKPLRKVILAALDQTPDLPEWLDTAQAKQQNWPSWKTAITKLHHPDHNEELEPTSKSRTRLAYDEFLANQLTLAIIRKKQKKLKGRTFITNGPHRQKLMAALPWELTTYQQDALKDIDADMGSNDRMLRLLQGDVGSGKTIVAALAMMNAIDSGTQTALMAPTEILARQHEQTLKPYLDAAGIPFVTLTGRDKGKIRTSILEDISSGKAKIVIGTHALFQDAIEFADLGCAVIDEQHRFGVHQRLQLSNKGRGVDVLVMTATPIPRTLALTAYGDMEVSRIVGKPPGRKPVDTRLIPQDQVEDMMHRLGEQIKQGVRAYWVCPLVEESEVLDLAAAEERYIILQSLFGDKVGLVHGRMKPKDKDEVMQKFAQGDISILVATTVIEVGVNVPEATIMVIEHAERFGLAQLHQLRGRVGRGRDQSYCFLVYAHPIGETAKERLKTLRATEDGFLIAEKDLELRGSGEVLGTKQSGLENFKLADLAAHADLLISARQDAALFLEKDPDLQSERGKALRTLLYLFERDQAISYLRSG
ncbi:MAG: ATP-dependent DNA helicase RecG [Alphaproteobacteria bacterium]|nr:ATP-dependent DNA helicase RecG [Alphaproteobacteria bacterium]